jgi:hypothetical protein
MAVQLREKTEYFASHYFSGVAIESILRALSDPKSGTFDSNHGIDYWAKKVNLQLKGSTVKQDESRAIFLELNLRWRANQRYYTAKMLDTWLYSVGLDSNLRGDRLKFSSNRMLELAEKIVFQGVTKWKKR